MSRIFFISLIFIILINSTFSNSFAALVKIEIPQISKHSLNNDLKLLLIERHYLPIVNLEMRFKAGSFCDPEGYSGLANLTAALIRTGTTSRNALKIAETIDSVGGKLDISCTRDYASISITVLKKDLDLAINLLSDLVMHPAFSEDELNRKRSLIQGNIRLRLDEPDSVTYDHFWEAIFNKHPYQYPVLGQISELDAIRRVEVQDFYSKYYRPNNAILAVVGDIDPNSILKDISSKFSEFKKSPLHFLPLPSVSAPSKNRLLLIDDDLTQSNVYLGFQSINYSDPDYPKLMLLNYILGGGGFASRLMDVVRSEKGLAYDVNSQFERALFSGVFYVNIQTKNANTADAIQSILKETSRIQQELVSSKELQDAIDYFTGSLPLRLETNESLANMILDEEFYGLGDNYFANLFEEIQKVTPQNIYDSANKHLRTDKIYIVIATKAEEVQPLLEGMGEIELLPKIKS